ncbi:MAG: TerB family tellurite resistance protein [Hyphomonadaceae bacterium]
MTAFHHVIAAPSEGGNSAALVLLVLIVVALGWATLRALMRRMRARKARATVGDSFATFALEALVNAAKLDGRVSESERAAIVEAMRGIAGEAFEALTVEMRLGEAKLSKSELVDYLAVQGRGFTREQKATLLKALVSVFVADSEFDETEHGALIDNTEAVGFERDSAPDLLRSFVRGNIT